MRQPFLSIDDITESVKNITLHIYETKDFSALPILADALEEAGFSREGTLYHFRYEYKQHEYGCIGIVEIMDFMKLHKLI